jgi:hypothetical protein
MLHTLSVLQQPFQIIIFNAPIGTQVKRAANVEKKYGSTSIYFALSKKHATLRQPAAQDPRLPYLYGIDDNVAQPQA